MALKVQRRLSVAGACYMVSDHVTLLERGRE